MRFLADEGISAISIAWLREHGHDVVGIREQGIFSADDSIVLALALANKATVLTRDVSDFSRIAHLAGEPHFGIRPLAQVDYLPENRHIFTRIE